jgi:hypothetical protein
MSSINELLKKSIYIHEKNEYGHLVIVLKDLIGIKSNKENDELFISKIIKEVENSLEISNRYGKKRGYIHVYFNDCSVTNAPISLFKKLNKVLTSKFDDTVEEIFIYSNSKFVSKLWGIIKFIVDSDTRDKIRIVKN